MKIGAVSVLRAAGPDGVTPAPAGAVVVVVHRGDHVVVDAACFIDRLGDVFGLLVRKYADDAVDWNQTIGQEEAVWRNERLAKRLDRRLEGNVMFESLGVKGDLDVKGLGGI